MDSNIFQPPITTTLNKRKRDASAAHDMNMRPPQCMRHGQLVRVNFKTRSVFARLGYLATDYTTSGLAPLLDTASGKRAGLYDQLVPGGR